jgi:hypothetical protein
MKTNPYRFERRGREDFAEGAEKSFALSLFSASSAILLRPLRSKGFVSL